MEQLKETLDKNKQRYLEELIELLKIPSVSADTAYNQDVLDCADAVAKSMQAAGLDAVELLATKGYPVVYGEKIIDANLPTVLVYGHYDVQPPDPLGLWLSPPFDPVVKQTEIHPNGAVFARGSADDKGQFFMHIKALEGMIANNLLPCNVKVMIEGEEEIGSESLEDFLLEYKEKLAADIVLISDTEMLAKEEPTLTIGLRGISYWELMVTGPDKDLHSGVYGGAVPNPINVLARMITKLHDENGRITIPGFYDKVAELSVEQREDFAKLPISEKDFLAQVGVTKTEGEKGYSSLEHTSTRPTLDANGIWGGYTGSGAKTVIPSKAYAKISMRLVPHQEVEDINRLFEDYIKQIAPESVKVKLTPFHGGMPYILPSEDVGYKAAKLALQESFGKEALDFRGGGSIPIVAVFQEILGLKSVLLGFGLNSDVIHSPNENFGLDNFYKGIETIPYFFKHYAELKKK